jgi:kynureninase
MNPQTGTGTTRDAAHRMDLTGSLAHRRQRFAGHDDAALYMDGNSRGRPPAGTTAFASQALDPWRDDRDTTSQRHRSHNGPPASRAPARPTRF